jgi:hypothetical protein
VVDKVEIIYHPLHEIITEKEPAAVAFFNFFRRRSCNWIFLVLQLAHLFLAEWVAIFIISPQKLRRVDQFSFWTGNCWTIMLDVGGYLSKNSSSMAGCEFVSLNIQQNLATTDA